MLHRAYNAFNIPIHHPIHINYFTAQSATSMHFLWACPQIQLVWSQALSYLTQETGQVHFLSHSLYLFQAIPSAGRMTPPLKRFKHLVLLVTKNDY